ncbi:MAG TPA: aminopeptidase P family protein [Candidatus Limnocylindria bacterium]|nr:aminopeptidase P family protein [Candidatus Limnocylindria bacterium]
MTIAPGEIARFADSVYADRMQRAAAAAGDRAIDALIVTPSIDYRYLVGYNPPPLERLTALVLRPDADPVLVLPLLEEPLAVQELGDLADGIDIQPWQEGSDPYQAVRQLLAGTRRVGVQDQMWARHALRFAAALDPIELVEAGPALSALRRVKSPEEVHRLRRAAQVADTVMLAATGVPLAGTSERQLEAKIRDLLVLYGHQVVDFAIVGSGPHSASPHHVPTDRVIRDGDAIVIDLGGTRLDYCSDTTRTAFCGDPPREFEDLYATLQMAQEAACNAVRPGVAASEIDRVARDVITEAGYGEYFIHRTGHGIGMETHEEPYIIAGNDEPLVAGMAFSVEPGIYVPGQWGARIEDIVVVTDDGGERLNTSATDLYLVG